MLCAENFAFFGRASAVYALFLYVLSVSERIGNYLAFFRGRNPYLFLLMYQKVRGSMEKRQHLLPWSACFFWASAFS